MKICLGQPCPVDLLFYRWSEDELARIDTLASAEQFHRILQARVEAHYPYATVYYGGEGETFAVYTVLRDPLMEIEAERTLRDISEELQTVERGLWLVEVPRDQATLREIWSIALGPVYYAVQIEPDEDAPGQERVTNPGHGRLRRIQTNWLYCDDLDGFRWLQPDEVTMLGQGPRYRLLADSHPLLDLLDD